MIDEQTLAQINGAYVCPDDAGPEWRAAYEAGMDMSLIEHALELTPAQRLAEHQQVTVTVSDQAEADWLDAAFLRHLEPQADESITLEQVRLALAKIPGSMTEDFRGERNERS